MTTRDEARIERGRRVLRMQGRAEAALILTARKVLPSMRLNDWANLLDVPMSVVEATRHRWRHGDRPAGAPARAPKKRRPETPGEFPCPVDGCDHVARYRKGLFRHHLAAHADPVPCPFCDRLCNPAGLGPHKRHCPQNPDRPTAA
jgi:hypothetical protein